MLGFEEVLEIRRIDVLSVAISDLSSITSLADHSSPLICTIFVTPATDDVKTLHRESQWVDVPVAHRTRFYFPMLGQLLADGGCTANVGFHSGSAGRGRFGGLVENAFHHPDPA